VLRVVGEIEDGAAYGVTVGGYDEAIVVADDGAAVGPYNGEAAVYRTS